MKPADAAGSVLDGLAGPGRAAFALLHRPETAPGVVELLTGPVRELQALAELAAGPGESGETLLLVPFRAAAEQGFDCADDGAPLLAMAVAERRAVPLAEALAVLPDRPLHLHGQRFEPDDAAYADIVGRVLTDEIGTGEGCNFVIRRSVTGTLADHTPAAALSAFRRLLAREQGAYWTFLVHTGTRTFVGATPERHVTLDGGVATMNPISGTYRYPPSGLEIPGLVGFLADTKETEELYMVLDEELKMMAQVCEDGGRVHGPALRQMSRLAHTEYFISGRSSLEPVEILRRTLLAPTVVGSPLANAFRVIRRYESTGRGHYAGVAALIGCDPRGRHLLDSAIMIRTAELGPAGRLRIDVGATLVRDSDPAAEAAETRAKAAGLLAAFGGSAADPGPAAPGPAGSTGAPSAADVPSAADHPEVAAALADRNADLARFWFHDHRPPPAAPELAGRRVLVVDADDTFTAMLRHQLASLGLAVTVRPHTGDLTADGFDLVVSGPGPGDPRDLADPKVATVHAALAALLADGTPLLAVCLSHQLLSGLLGLRVVRRDRPSQGMRRRIDLFGRPERVGFYNTFVALSDADRLPCPYRPGEVDVARDPRTGEVYALRGPGFQSLQFHAESVLTRDGVRILGDAVHRLLVPVRHGGGGGPVLIDR
ncbi:anthranilate synthase family protein [Kitasatospora sp. NPDC048540]|uniref:anthranilate synthase family protein n=1 Tax=Kitasatospora sp. NPDC048540 TaxID=3155634 RepID=UPI0033E59B6E